MNKKCYLLGAVYGCNLYYTGTEPEKQKKAFNLQSNFSESSLPQNAVALSNELYLSGSKNIINEVRVLLNLYK